MTQKSKEEFRARENKGYNSFDIEYLR